MNINPNDYFNSFYTTEMYWMFFFPIYYFSPFPEMIDFLSKIWFCG